MDQCLHGCTVGLINIATKTPAPVPLGEGLSIVPSKEWWNPVELELEFWLQYLSPTVISCKTPAQLVDSLVL